MKTAIIFGVTGQDGSYLAELLLEKKYKVVGVKRRSATGSLWRLNNVINKENFTLIEGDITDYSCCLNIINTYKIDEIYNLAAQSNVGSSFNQPGYTWDVTAKGVLNILESMRFLKSKARLYQASSSEMFGSAGSVYNIDKKARLDFKHSVPQVLLQDSFQDENTKLNPQSPYAIAKLAAHNAIGLYRNAFNIFCVGGILFNHESPRRGSGFVTRKITKWFKDFISWKSDLDNPYKCRMDYDYNITGGWISSVRNPITPVEYGHPDCWVFGPKYEKLKLGNINSFRDWGYAKEYVEAMWLMLQQDTPKDYIIGTGETHSVRDFLQEIMNYYNINTDIKEFINIDENCKRPAEVPYLRADAGLAEKELGWKPKTRFKELVKLMVEQENGLD